MTEPGIFDQPSIVPPDIIEQELGGIAELSETDEERLSLVYDVMEGLLQPRRPSKLYDKARTSGVLREETTEVGGEIKHFLLPDISGGGDINTIRETEGSYLRTEHRTIINCAQGHMWEVPLSGNPTVGVGLSECSLLFAKTPENTMIIAHISYSEPKEMNAVIQLFRDRGIPPEQWYAVASVGKFQEKKAKMHDRYATVNRYIDQGFHEGNIYPFEHFQSSMTIEGQYGEETVGVYNGLVSIILTPDECMMRQFSAWYDFKRGQEHVVSAPTYDSFSH